VLDWARIEAIAPGDQAFANELLNTFIASTRETLRELRAAAGRGDRNAIVRCAHRLKGASGNIGALRMEQRARDLEATALRIAEPELETELDAFDAEARRIHDAVLATATKK
jgi:HPt (histidine-containing phosphotransfer) domain-containing protein